MTVHKLTAGDGYTYLMRHVAGGDVDRARGQDAASYLTAEGNPPGRWLGAGIPALGLVADTVTEPQMRALFGLGLHPEADTIIAEYQTARITAATTEAQLEQLTHAARQHAALGRQFPVYAVLEPYEKRVAERLRGISTDMQRHPTSAEVGQVRREEASRQRAAVAGYDLVFAPVKSAALLWALDEREWVRQAVRDAHDEARDAALAMLEEHAAYTRTGKAGVAQIATRGLVAVAFDHYDSRCGDPNLHTHLALANKIQGLDGKWRSLDGRALYQVTVAVSEFYNTAFETALTARLPVRFAARAGSMPGKEPVREIVGVPSEWITHFSRRRTQLEARYAQLLSEYRAAHGRDPSRSMAHKLARRANLDTREGKKPPRSLPAMRADWRGQISTAFGPSALGQLRQVVDVPHAVSALGRDAASIRAHSLTASQVDEFAAIIVARVAEKRSTWTRWNVHAETERLVREHSDQLGPLGGMTGHRTTVARIVDQAVSASHSISIDVPALTEEPASLRRADGVSVFVQHAAGRYTSRAILDAEQRLLHATTDPASSAGRARIGLPAESVAAALDGFAARNGRPLDAGQRDLVTAFATASTLVAVGIGAAGTGKTTAMKALRHVTDAHSQRLIPLATSAASAAVLAADLGVPAENLHKFLWEHTPGHGAHAAALNAGDVPPSHRFYMIAPGDVILVDEAGMAGTLLLDQLVAIAARHGACVRLLGDWRQLGAVESGGALRLLAHEAGAIELVVPHRFTDPAEAAATLALRTGDTAALDFHEKQRRIRGGSRLAMAETAYAAWRADMRAGRTTLLIAATNTDITALSARARADRVAAGQVAATGVPLRDGSLAGRGDWIVTRTNQRTLTVNQGKDWVKNGDAWTVLRQGRDGSLRVRHQGHGGRITLPADYVAEHVQLHYATTTHRAQGATVDAAHLLADEGLSRENLYVALTRGRIANHVYVVTHELLPLDEDQRGDRPRLDPDARAAREVLDAILATDHGPLSATDTIRRAQQQAASLATLAPRYLHAAEEAATAAHRDLVHQLLDLDTASAITTDPAFGAVVRALRRGENRGWQPAQLLVRAANIGPLTAAESPAQLMAWRCAATLADHSAPLPLVEPTAADARRYAGLLATRTGQNHRGLNGFGVSSATGPDAAAALHRPAALTVRTGDATGRRADHYQAILTGVLGARRAVTVAMEPAWPALAAAVRRSDQAGHDAAKVLAHALRQRDLATARSISEVLAWRIGRYLEEHPTGTHTARADAWSTVAWTLKAHEERGGQADQVLNTIPAGIRLEDLPDALHAAIGRIPSVPDRASWIPPWLDAADTSPDAEHADYLDTARTQITARINALTADAQRHRPAWTTVFGTPPDDPADQHNWRHQLGIVAAYRDQHQVSDDTAAQPLGPYVSPGRAGHRAYWLAAHAILTAHQIANPARARQPADPVTATLAADVYAGLPDTDRARIAADLAARLGPLWLGSPEDPDTAATQPGYASHLTAALHQHGHLTTDSAPTTRPATEHRLHAASEAEHLARLAEESRQRRAKPSRSSARPNNVPLQPPTQPPGNEPTLRR